MKIATWNVNSLTARWPRVDEWLETESPDILLIQETKQTDAKFPFDGFSSLGYESAHYGQGQWNGVAIVSRHGIDDVVRGFGDDDPDVYKRQIKDWPSRRKMYANTFLIYQSAS